MSDLTQSESRTSHDDITVTSRVLVDAVYSLPLETIFALYDGDTLVKASTTNNPAKLQRIWKFELGELCMSADVKKPDLVSRAIIPTTFKQ